MISAHAVVYAAQSCLMALAWAAIGYVIHLVLPSRRDDRSS